MKMVLPRVAWIFFDPAASRCAADAKLGLAPSDSGIEGAAPL
jgi:hypothetical protein